MRDPSLGYPPGYPVTRPCIAQSVSPRERHDIRAYELLVAHTGRGCPRSERRTGRRHLRGTLCDIAHPCTACDQMLLTVLGIRPRGPEGP